MDRSISRRDFLKLMGVGALVFGFGALGGFAGLFRKQQSYVLSAQPTLKTISQPNYLLYTNANSSMYYALNPVTGRAIDNSSFGSLMSTINSNLSSGGTIAFKTGTYNIDSPITLTHRINLVGAGKGKSIFLRTTTASTNTFTHQGANVTVSGITFNGNYPKNTSNSLSELLFKTSTANVIECEFKAFNAIALDIDQITSNIINCVFIGAATANISSFGIWSSAGITAVSNSSFTGCYENAMFTGGATRISNCYFANNASVSGGQIGFQSTTSGTVTFTVENCTFDADAGAGHGIEIGGNSPAVGKVTLINNRIQKQSCHGIASNAGPTILFKSAMIRGNIIKNCGQSAAGFSGIFIGGGQTNYKIVENFCFDDQTTHTQSYGIHIDDTANNHYVIEKNVCFDNITSQTLDEGTGTDKRVGCNIGYNHASSISPAGSGFTYTNRDGYPEYVAIVPGMLTTPFAQLKRGATTIQLVTSSQPLAVLLQQGDAVTVTYSRTPTMAKFPQLFCNTGVQTPICK
jgi:hypothetical protein